MEKAEKIKVKSVVPFGNAPFFEKIGFTVVSVGIFLAPIFFIPSINFPFQFSKALLIVLATLLASVSFFVMVMLLIVAAALFQSRDRIFLSYAAFLVAALIIFVFQTIRLIFPAWLTFGGIFSGNTSSLIGRFNDLGIVFGAVTLLSLVTTELLALSKFFRFCLYIVLVIALLALAVVNFSTIWLAVASFALILFVYLLAIRRTAINQNGAQPVASVAPESVNKRKISYAALAVLVVASIFIADNFTQSKPLGSRIAGTLNIAQFEVRPSWQATFDVSLRSLTADPVFGVGQNRFAYEWLRHKPPAINNTIFWNTDFNFGIGLIPSTVVTTGVLGFVFLLVVIVTTGAVVARKFAALVNFQKALLVFNTKGDIVATEAGLKRAINLNEIDIYNRFLAELYLVKISNLFSRNVADLNTEAAKAEFQASFGEAIKYAKRAIELNDSDYQNWVEAGRVYAIVVPIKIAGAYESALSNYNKALELNPRSPLLYLTLARLALANNDSKKARTLINQVLELKSDYTDAIFLLAQIDVDEGNLNEAIKSVEKIAELAPNDPTVFFQLGLLNYNDKNYKKAVEGLERAVTLLSNYANARYFLGLSYYQIGKNNEAVKQFAEIQKTNPGNQEIDLILKNLKAGRAPFTNAKAPVDNKPESRAKPPIEEPTPKE